MKPKKYRLPKRVREVSMRPYPARLFACYSTKDYLSTYAEVFGGGGSVPENTLGRFGCGTGKDGFRSYIVWAVAPQNWAHEISHVLIDLLPGLGFNLNNTDSDEAFCYMMSSLLQDILPKTKQ